MSVIHYQSSLEVILVKHKRKPSFSVINICNFELASPVANSARIEVLPDSSASRQARAVQKSAIETVSTQTKIELSTRYVSQRRTQSRLGKHLSHTSGQRTAFLEADITVFEELDHLNHADCGSMNMRRNPKSSLSGEVHTTGIM
jgi:hypothetical protein